jgi:hypothetical protein
MPDMNSGCWLWTGGLYSNGYGMTTLGGWKVTQAHRASYTAFKGPIPDGMFVCHTCDVKACVNPDHLFLGEPADNSADMVSKGRSAKGSAHGSAKLTEDKVSEIRSLLSSGAKHREISQKYGIAVSNVSFIATRKAWRHVT